MNSKWLVLLATALAAFGCNANAEPQPASSCSFVVFTDEWRDATSKDYDSDDWRAFTKFTGVQTPWKIEGDFNGDGLSDVARVVIKDETQEWMLGVEFGAKSGAKCAKYQMMQGRPGEMSLLPGLQVLPQGARALKCHQAGHVHPVVCNVPNDSPVSDMAVDAIIVSDAVPVRAITAYYWAERDGRTRSDGSLYMDFHPAPLNTAIKWD